MNIKRTLDLIIRTSIVSNMQIWAQMDVWICFRTDLNQIKESENQIEPKMFRPRNQIMMTNTVLFGTNSNLLRLSFN